MRSNFFPPEHHDFTPTAEIRNAAKHNRRFLEAKFHGDLADFRANIFSKLDSHDALVAKAGWAIFDTSPTEKRGGLAVDGNNREVLVILLSGEYEDDHLAAPTVRIVVNEQIDTPDVKPVWLTEDFIADGDGDTQYFIDSASPLDENWSQRTLGPLFVVPEPGVLSMSANFQQQFPPVYGIGRGEAESDIIYPFGHYATLEDKIFALERGRAIFDEIVNLQPTHVGAR